MTAFEALADTLRELADVVRPLSRVDFVRRDVRASGSIGAHVRHCLDHLGALEHGIATGTLSYDHRVRDTVVERDRELAASRLRRAAARLTGLADAPLDRRLVLEALIAQGRVCACRRPSAGSWRLSSAIRSTMAR